MRELRKLQKKLKEIEKLEARADVEASEARELNVDEQKKVGMKDELIKKIEQLSLD